MLLSGFPGCLFLRGTLRYSRMTEHLFLEQQPWFTILNEGIYFFTVRDDLLKCSELFHIESRSRLSLVNCVPLR
jgi:hypothetical protein